MGPIAGTRGRFVVRQVSKMRTYCRICEAACGLQVQRDEQGTPTRLQPDREHPVSDGYACAKGTRFLELAQHPDRLLHPQLDGARASWPEAVGEVARRFRAVIDAHGPHAVGVYFGNPMAFNTLGLVATQGFVRSLGTRNVFFAGSQDCNNKFAGADIVHKSPVVQAFPDFEHTDFALVLGSNPYVSQSSFVHLEGGNAAAFGGIIERGGEIVWVDPRRTQSAARWGEHVPIRPGTDVWLLLALLGLVDARTPDRAQVEGWEELRAVARSLDLGEVELRTGVSRATIESLASRLCAAKSAVVHMSVGVNMGGFGTLAYVALQALAWATGNYDTRGGLLISPLAGPLRSFFRRTGLARRSRSRVGGFDSVLGMLPGGILADEILTPGPERIRALLVLAGDPLRSIPGASRLEEGLKSLDVLACVDMFVNATGRHAHAVLPATTWLERWDAAVVSAPFQQSRLVQVGAPVLPPQGESKTDAMILGELAVAMGLPGPHWRLARKGIDRWLPRPKLGFRGPTLRPGRWLRRNRLRFWDERVQTEVDRLRAEPLPQGDAFVLIGRRRRLAHNSWLHGGHRSGSPESVAWLCPDDLAALGLRDGDRIEVARGDQRLTLPARGVEGVAPRTVVVPHGLPDVNVNRLIPAGPDNIERVSGQLRMTAIEARVRAAG